MIVRLPILASVVAAKSFAAGRLDKRLLAELLTMVGRHLCLKFSVIVTSTHRMYGSIVA